VQHGGVGSEQVVEHCLVDVVEVVHAHQRRVPGEEPVQVRLAVGERGLEFVLPYAALLPPIDVPAVARPGSARNLQYDSCLTVSQWAPNDHRLDRASPAAATDGRSRPRVCLLKVSAVRARYEHLARSWRRATPERRRGLIGELELLALQLPAVSPDDPDRDDRRVTGGHPGIGHRDRHRARRPGLTRSTDLADSDAAVRPVVPDGSGRGGHHPEPVPGCVLDEDGHHVTGGVGVEMPVRAPHHPVHQVGVQVGELT
jgi:hypothetical protein